MTLCVFCSVSVLGFVPHREVAAPLLLPSKELCGTFHTSNSGTGLACVCGTLMCPEAAL